MTTLTNTFTLTVKKDTEANWLVNDFIPAIGEVIVYTPDANNTYSRFKVGNGSTLLSNLPVIFTLADSMESYIDEQIIGGEW